MRDYGPSLKTSVHRTRIAFVVLLVVAAMNGDKTFGQLSLKKSSQPVVGKSAAPPLMTKLQEYIVITPLPDGRLMGLPNNPMTIDGEQVTAVRYSTDNGVTWSEPTTLFKQPKEPKGGFGVQVSLVDLNGEIHLFFQNDMDTLSRYKELKIEDLHIDIWHTKSFNGRKEWEPLQRIWSGYAGSMLSVTQMRNGRIVLPICYRPIPIRNWSARGEGFDAFSYMGTFQSSVLYSDDGNTWHQSKAEFKAPSSIIFADGLIEPGVIQLKDGRVWLLIRTQSGRFYESYSTDGANWSPVQATEIISSDSPGNLIRLKTGQLVMVWNEALRFSYANGGRHILHAAITDDEGKTWRGFREVARNPLLGAPPPITGDHGVTYTVLNQTPDGKIVTPLYTGHDLGIYLLHFDPFWLYETKRKADFSAELDTWSTFGTKGVEFVAHPQKSGARVLSLRKPEAGWPAAAVWNFPAGGKGSVSLKLQLKTGFQGASIGLTDHFSVPFDYESQFFNLFNLDIGPNGQVGDGRITPGGWHELRLDWDTSKHECLVALDGRQVQVLPLNRMSRFGANYFRIRSTAQSTDDAGLLIESIEADTSASWVK